MANNCPTSDELSDYTQGNLSLGVHTSVEHHLDECPSCRETIAVLDADSGTQFSGLHRVISDARQPLDPELQELAASAKALIRGSSDPISSNSTPKWDGDQPTIAQGTVLGNYVVGEALGGGNMGFVYRAYHQRMKRDVALKFVLPSLIASADARLRFQREIESAAKLNHPNIVTAFDADEADGYYFLVLELIEGTDLRQIVKDSGPLPINQALGYVAQAAQGLGYAHEKGIIHRDIKPSNLLLDKQERVKVADLGLARDQFISRDALDQEATQTGIVAGTPAFMSPEQRLDLRIADERSDVYSLGCTAFYLLTEKTVPQAAHSNPVAGNQQGLVSVRTYRPDCPKSIDSLIQNMLATNADERLPSMDMVIQAIDKLPVFDDVREAPSRKPSTSMSRRGWGWTAAMSVAGLLLILIAIQTLPFLNSKGRRQDAESALNQTTTDQDEGRPQSGFDARPIIEMVRIEPGSFQMGSPGDDAMARASEKPSHQVAVSRPFLLGKYEVTIAQYAEVMEVDAGTFPVPTEIDGDSDVESLQSVPVSGTSWLEAVRFCNRLSDRHGLPPFYRVDGETVSVNRESDGFRLPTEAEWEFSCRAGSKTSWCFGDDAEQLGEHAWFAGNSNGSPRPVGTKQPNDFGLHDMHGNVPEWCWDRYDEEYYSIAEAIDPPGSSQGEDRVFRGGGATSRAPQTRSAQRNPLGESYGFFNAVGFRVARSVN